MDLENLRVLIQVVESGSVLRAARALGVSRSLLRRRLDALDAEVGSPLLHRDTAGVQLTSSGEVFAARGKALIAESEALVAEARMAAGEASGAIRVFEPVGMPIQIRAQTLLATHMGLSRLRVVVRPVEDPVAWTQENCHMLLHEGAAPDSANWYSRVLIRVPMRLMAAPTYLSARGTPTSLAELEAHDVLLWQRIRQPTNTLPLLGGGEHPVKPWLVSTDLTLLRAIAARGGGLLYTPQLPGLDSPLEAPLVSIMSDHFGGELAFRASSRHASKSDVRTESTLEHIRRFIESLPE